MKYLVIVESPAKAKTIEKYLGKDYTVVSSVGHIRDLAIKGQGGLGVDVENQYQPTYTYIKGKKTIVTDLKKEAKKVNQVLLATDPDREGEAISWHLADELELELDEKNRVIFNEITPSGVEEGIKNRRSIDLDLVHSQESRRIIDRIMGFKLSKLLQKKIKVKSAGRVQSVALRMIVEREEEIRAFKPIEYWKLFAEYKKLQLDYEKNSKKLSEKTVKALFEQLENNQELLVADVKQKTTKQKPKLAFTTSTLQQTAVNRLGFGSKQVMQVAQKLYEGIEINGQFQGLITYMRTDSTRLSDEFQKKTYAYISSTFGKDFVGGYPKIKTKSGTQDAHEAIRPTDVNNHPEKIKKHLTPQQFKLYSLIWNRTVSALMAPAILETTTYVFEHESEIKFKTSNTTVEFEGYRKVYFDDEEEATIDLKFKKDQRITVDKFTKTQHFTQPPARYSEAKLIKEMEENGIGRPSTYASIIDILKQRNYVDVEKRRFIPTEDGELVVNRLREFFTNFIAIQYTSQLEQLLDDIAVGKAKEFDVIDGFYHEFIKLLETAESDMVQIQAQETGETCPECGRPLVVRKGRYGEFVACSGFPECKYIQPAKEIKSYGSCPKCNEGNVIEKHTKRGKAFYGCDRFPKCDYAVWNEKDIGKIIEKEKKKK